MTIAPRRVYLPDESANPRADQLYGILTFGAIHTLRVPIMSARWRRIGIHHTTWGTLTRTYDLGALTRVTRQLRGHATAGADDTDCFDLLAPDDDTNSHVPTITDFRMCPPSQIDDWHMRSRGSQT